MQIEATESQRTAPTLKQEETAEKIPLIVVAGPTASGKTALAVELAKRLLGEIVSADSMQIYKGLPVGTAQPSLQEQKGIPHHLIGFLSPSETFSAAQYVERASACIADIRRRGRIPILAGGTGLYISSLIHNICFVQEDPPAGDLRQKLSEKAERDGWEALLQELAARDPEAAAAMDFHNHKRLLRSLELCIITGKTAAQRAEESRSIPSPYICSFLCLWFADRQKLYDRIDERVDGMMQEGLLQEAESLFHGSPGKTVRQAIGYKEFFPYFSEEIPVSQAVETVKRETRRYAKRQLTWFRREKEAVWLDVGAYSSLSALADAAEGICREKLKDFEECFPKYSLGSK